MCIAIVVPAGVPRPTREQHKAFDAANPHGCGVAWLDTTGNRPRVRWAKGMYTPDSMFEFIEQLPEGPILLHYRIASSGGVSAELCHPFPVARVPALTLTGVAKSVLIHNGTWSALDREPIDYDSEGKALPTSDTRVMASIAYGSIVGLKALSWHYGKMAILHADGTIDMGGTWHTKDGIHYSNLHWEPKPPRPWKPKTLKGQYASYNGGHGVDVTPPNGVPISSLVPSDDAVLSKYRRNHKELSANEWEDLLEKYDWDDHGNLVKARPEGLQTVIEAVENPPQFRAPEFEGALFSPQELEEMSTSHLDIRGITDRMDRDRSGE